MLQMQLYVNNQSSLSSLPPILQSVKAGSAKLLDYVLQEVSNFVFMYGLSYFLLCFVLIFCLFIGLSLY